jgi:dTDP-4-dehydrorhamnose reductase
VIRERHELYAIDIEEVDITDGPATIALIEKTRPDAIVHTAAYTDVDGCESHIDQAFRVNGEGTRHVAEGAHRSGASILYVSTDYVFDGTKGSPYVETDPAASVNFYGLTKLFGERYASSLNPRHLIVRASWLFGPNGKNFVDTILEKARAGQALRVVDDQRGCPTYTYHLARGLKAAVEAGIEGILHMTNAGDTTWYEFARAALEMARVKAEIEPIGSASYVTKAKRPANSVLASVVMERSGLEPLPDWREGLRHHLGRKAAAGR